MLRIYFKHTRVFRTSTLRMLSQQASKPPGSGSEPAKTESAQPKTGNTFDYDTSLLKFQDCFLSFSVVLKQLS